MTLESGEHNVSIRGFNQRLSNKVLVLIDGRSVYLDFIGITLWSHLWPAMEEIERIEVIRGPGSALYGADAFTGVINIITRAPGENRNVVSLGVGNGQRFRGAFLTSGRQGELSYRASVQYEQQTAFERPVSDDDNTWQYASPGGDIGFRTPRFSLDLQQRLGRGMVLRGGVGLGTGLLLFTPTGLLRRYWADITFVQPYVQLEAGGFTGRVFWNRASANAGPLLVPIGGRNTSTRTEQDVVDVDLQYATRQTMGAVQNTLQLGLGYRWKHISWSYLDADHGLHFFSGFIQDTLRVSDRFSVVASARADRHPVLENVVFSPRAAVIYRPTERRAIRVAVRTPTMLELYFDLYYPTPIPGVTVTGEGSEVARARHGSPPLRPETALSFDVGYQDQTSDHVQFEANLFWTRGVDIINLGNVVVDPLPGAPSRNREVNVGPRAFVNFPGATYVYGAEFGTRVSPIDGLDILANYTLALTQHDPDSPLAGGPGLTPDQRTPMHKLNVGVQVRSRAGVDFEAFGHYVSRQVWIEPVFDPRQGSRDVNFPLSDYFVLNARLGYRLLQDRLDLGLVGTNITDVVATQGHQEHPLGARLSFRALATASYRF
jgi:iron complex outermembrane receptor protein